MKKKDKNVLDPLKKVSLVRFPVESIQSSLDNPLMSAPKKIRKLNIPICDVLIDNEYEKNVQPNFKLPTSFIRHTKKIGDEPDVTIDYNMEDDDLKWLEGNPRLSNDKDAVKYLTIDAFEKIIDIFERHTGFAIEPLPQTHAEKIVSDTAGFKWPASVISKIIPEIYCAWIAKREKYGKPMSRRYCPQTGSNDTNPHHVFRPRDKEKYRLRRQQRKNDIEAYRKMQKLRKEFERARELLQLVLEREMLSEASLEVQTAIFETSLCEGSGGEWRPTEMAAVVPYQLQSKHLLRLPAGQDSPLPVPAMEEPPLLADTLVKQPVQQPLVLLDNQASQSQPIKQDEAIASTVPSLPSETKRDTKRDAARKPAPKRKSPVPPPPHPEQPRAARPLPGPAHICRPVPPHFLQPLATRQTMRMPLSFSAYLEELELPQDLLRPPSRFHRPTLYSSSDGDHCPWYSPPLSLKRRHSSMTEESSATVESPCIIQYHCRGRIGRGGRFVMDRVPIITSDAVLGRWDAAVSTNHLSYVYPTSLSTAMTSSKRLTASGSELFPKLVAADGVGIRCPPLLPLGQGPPSALQRAGPGAGGLVDSEDDQTQLLAYATDGFGTIASGSATTTVKYTLFV